MRLLLGSGGIRTPERKQAWCAEWSDFLGSVRDVLFVPWALHDAEESTAKMQAWLDEGGVEVRLDGIHTHADPRQAVADAQAIFVTGGNTFRLVKRIHEHDLLQVVRERVRGGMPYIGVSAGTNVSTPTLATTNDMPICFPPSDETFGLVPFQINPHFVPGTAHYVIDGEIVPYGGETREDRLSEYHEMNDRPVLCLREGAILRVEGERATLTGIGGGLLLRKGADAEPLEVGADLSHLLRGE